MRAYDNGSFFTVSYTADDAYAFSRRWPTSTVRGRGYFEYDKRNGDLIGTGGSADRGDGEDWLAFSQDLQWYGEKKLGLSTGHALNPDSWITDRFPKLAKKNPLSQATETALFIGGAAALFAGLVYIVTRKPGATS